MGVVSDYMPIPAFVIRIDFDFKIKIFDVLIRCPLALLNILSRGLSRNYLHESQLQPGSSECEHPVSISMVSLKRLDHTCRLILTGLHIQGLPDFNCSDPLLADVSIDKQCRIVLFVPNGPRSPRHSL